MYGVLMIAHSTSNREVPGYIQVLQGLQGLQVIKNRTNIKDNQQIMWSNGAIG